MKLALFDLDNTLIAGDSDYLWGQFLCENGYVDATAYTDGHDRYYQDYLAGSLDIAEFLYFQLNPLKNQPMDELRQRRQRYIEEKIMPIILPDAKHLVEAHRKRGHHLLIITATNRFLTEPIAQLFGVSDLIACEPEIKDGYYTGGFTGIPSYAAGKVDRLKLWLDEQNGPLQTSWFYSDSHNDIPLLEYVDHAIAVDPDTILKNTAKDRNWPIISLRTNATDFIHELDLDG